MSATRLHSSGSTRNVERDGLWHCMQAANAAGSAQHADRTPHEGDGDVYMFDEDAGPGVWEVEHVLDASFGDNSLAEAQTLSIEVRPGAETVVRVKSKTHRAAGSRMDARLR